MVLEGLYGFFRFCFCLRKNIKLDSKRKGKNTKYAKTLEVVISECYKTTIFALFGFVLRQGLTLYPGWSLTHGTLLPQPPKALARPTNFLIIKFTITLITKR